MTIIEDVEGNSRCSSVSMLIILNACHPQCLSFLTLGWVGDGGAFGQRQTQHDSEQPATATNPRWGKQRNARSVVKGCPPASTLASAGSHGLPLERCIRKRTKSIIRACLLLHSRLKRLPYRSLELQPNRRGRGHNQEITG